MKNTDNSIFNNFMKNIEKSMVSVLKDKNNSKNYDSDDKQYIMNILEKSDLDEKIDNIKNILDKEDFNFPKYSYITNKKIKKYSENFTEAELQFLDSLFGFCVVSLMMSKDSFNIINMSQNMTPKSLSFVILFKNPNIFKKVHNK